MSSLAKLIHFWMDGEDDQNVCMFFQTLTGGPCLSSRDTHFPLSLGGAGQTLLLPFSLSRLIHKLTNLICMFRLFGLVVIPSWRSLGRIHWYSGIFSEQFWHWQSYLCCQSMIDQVSPMLPMSVLRLWPRNNLPDEPGTPFRAPPHHPKPKFNENCTSSSNQILDGAVCFWKVYIVYVYGDFNKT